MEQSSVVAIEDLITYIAGILRPSTGTVMSPLIPVEVFGSFRREYPPTYTTCPAFDHWA